MSDFLLCFYLLGERLIQFASENLVTEILIHPQYNTLIQCMRNLLSSFTRHRHIIHSGYTFSGNGSWILQVCNTILYHSSVCPKKNNNEIKSYEFEFINFLILCIYFSLCLFISMEIQIGCHVFGIGFC